MTELATPEIALGGMTLAAVILYSAWQEFKGNNPRDAKLLATVGAIALMGGTVAWMN